MALKLELLRPDDLLNLQVECHNLKLDTADAEKPEKPVLVPIDAQAECHLVFVFPSQTVEETAFFEVAPGPDLPAPTHPDPPASTVGQIPTIPVRARLGGESRLVFRIPANAVTRIPYSPEGLLSWAEYEFRVSAMADVPENPNASQISSYSLAYRMKVKPRPGR